MALRHVDPTKPPGALARVYAALATTRIAKFISRHVSWRLDPVLLQASGGRLASTLVFPTAVLETRGARTEERRRNAIIYFHDSDRVIIVASNAGDERHPAWFHNLRAHPEVTLGNVPMQAAVVDDAAECARLWPLADRVFPGFASYRLDAAARGRTIPIVQLIERRPGSAP